MSATDLSPADLDAGGTYRYRLTRTWDRSQPQVTWVMLNPSTATADTDDPTIRRVVGFSRRWGFGSAVVVNLFALRATRPGDLVASHCPVGPDNDRAILEALSPSSDVVAAWGNHGRTPNPLSGRPRCEEVLDLISGRSKAVRCLARTKQGQPRHPLYLPADTVPFHFETI